MKKITIVLLLIVSLILPQTVSGAEDEPYNAWTSCARNFVKYSNAGEYCIIVEVQGSANDIQYILCHDIANRNPMIYEGGAIRRFLNLYDTSRYEVYYSDYVQSMTGLSNIFSGNKLELGVRHPSTGFYAQIVRTNYTLFNVNGQAIYDPNYISEVTDFYDENDKPDEFGIPFDCPYKVNVEDSSVQAVAIYRAHSGNGDEYYYFAPTSKSNGGFNFTGEYKLVEESNNLVIYLETNKQYNGDGLLRIMYDGVLRSDITLSGNATTGWVDNVKFPDSERAAVRRVIGNKDAYTITGLNFEWYYDNPVQIPITPTPLVKPTAAPLASPTPEPGEDNGIFGLGNTIKRIFLPSPDILYNEVNASKDLLMTKLHIDLDTFNPELAGRPQNVTMEIYGQTVTLLDFEQIEEVAEQARTPINIVRVFVYIFALWGLIKFIIDYFNNRGGGNNA